jgi:putative heme-binding domain-containing protein
MAALLLAALLGGPVYLEERFELPEGFRIYKAAARELSGGSYALTFDAEGRLLVGDGAQVRRLEDRDGDGVFDHSEVIAGGLGPRGPQGLLVWGDRLYAVGGDGIQLFEGYRSGGPLVHRGRLGAPFRTGGDHDAHTVLRGHDGYLYFITGDGGGARDRVHITEETSPCLFERAASVFRLSPGGERWECIGSGGRNPPSLGMNYLGELFSLDSDMEWHVDLPWWRPVRLNHWLSGGDQGWQDVGAHPPYAPDCLPGVLDAGRGSPDWGVFYEHRQLPERYHDAFLVCDYLSKSATTGGYETSGRLFAFRLERRGAGWKAEMEVLARPRAGARDDQGRRIDFALVDIAVAPGGSLFLSDHNQGVWRLLYDPDGKLTAGGAPPIAPRWPELPASREALLDELLGLAQPAAEWSRAREERIRAALGGDCGRLLEETALDSKTPLRRRLRALRLLAPEHESLDLVFLERLAGDGAPEVRGQAAWLLGLGGKTEGSPLLGGLLRDADAFVRRRAAEALARCRPEAAELGPLVERLADAERLVAHAAMVALSRLPAEEWLEGALRRREPQARMRALIGCDLARKPAPSDVLLPAVGALLDEAAGFRREERLDLLWLLFRFRGRLGQAELKGRIAELALTAFPDPDPDVRREQVRLLGEYRAAAGFSPLLALLEAEQDPVAQFHIAQALARIEGGWSAGEEERAVNWFLGTQRGWFADFAGKGLQFPHFWSSVLSEFASRHRQAFLARLSEVDLAGLLGGAVVDLLSQAADAAPALVSLYRAHPDPGARRRLLRALRRVRDPKVASLLREEYLRFEDQELRGEALRALSAQAPEPESRPHLEEGILHRDHETVSACMSALAGYGLELAAPLCARVIARMAERREVFPAAERLLAALSGAARPGSRRDGGRRDGGRREPERRDWEEGLRFWKEWYADRFGEEFRPPERAVEEKSDEELHRFLLGAEVEGGDAARGRKTYEAVRCASCHGGAGAAASELAVFGPDLAGVTRRLSREQLADAIVYPSKEVADRFKATVVQVKGGLPLTGFITEESETAITLVDPERAHRLERKDLLFTAPQETSLMPERLLNRLSWDEVRDLYAFLEELGSRPAPEGEAGEGK